MIKVNKLGIVSVESIVIWTPVSDRSITLHVRSANPFSRRIHAFAAIFLREALRWSLGLRLRLMARVKDDKRLLQ